MFDARPGPRRGLAVAVATASRPRVRVAVWAALIGLLAAFPMVSSDPYLLYLATVVGIYVLVAMGFNVLFGYAGQVSLGHGALVAVGAYATAILTVNEGWSFWASMPIAVVAASLVGGVMALPALRLSSWHLALITLAFAMVVNSVLVEWRSLTGGFAGILGIPRPELDGLPITDVQFYWLVLAIACLGYFLVRNVVRSRIGRALVGVRDAAEATSSAGASPVWIKVFAFGLSAALAGLAGALLAGLNGIVTPGDFSLDFSIFFLLVVLVGGAGRLGGPLVGAFAFFVLPEILESLAEWRLLIYGVLLLVMLVFAPRGIAGAWARLVRGAPPATPRPVDEAAAPAEREQEVVGLDVLGAAKSFGGVQALRGVDLSAAPGSIHAVVGPNGSGKTTLLNVVSGHLRQDGGQILLGTADISRWSATRVARAGIGRTFQTPRLLPDLSAIDNVLLGAYARERARGLELLLGLPRARRESSASRREARHYLQFVGLNGDAENPVSELPHGQQRLIEVARALMAHPRVLLMDEPAAGLSLTELDALGQLLREIKSRGITVVMVEHHIELVTDVADHVTVLDEGAALVSAEPTVALQDERVLEAYLGK